MRCKSLVMVAALLIGISAQAEAAGSVAISAPIAAIAASNAAAAANAAAANAQTDQAGQASGSNIFGPDVLLGGELKIDWIKFSIDYGNGKDAVTVKGNDGKEWEPISGYVQRRHAKDQILGVYWDFHSAYLYIFYRANK
ncbi:MAG TPA: hypothetical protein VHD31_02520 [Candidatus Paceibacterota bacterium]|nr:hypothetical protein [Candidatus Paceibacterota bacterium]